MATFNGALFSEDSNSKPVSATLRYAFCVLFALRTGVAKPLVSLIYWRFSACACMLLKQLATKKLATNESFCREISGFLVCLNCLLVDVFILNLSNVVFTNNHRDTTEVKSQMNLINM